jgi:hypothetical protein
MFDIMINLKIIKPSEFSVSKKDPVKSHITHLIERQYSTTVDQQTS